MANDDYKWFKFKFIWIDVLEKLSKSEADRLLEAMYAYVNDEPLPDLIGRESIPWILIKPDLEEDRQRIKKHKKSIERYGEAKVVRRSGEYARWRKKVFERDEYTCQLCGEKGGKLNAHHKVRFVDCPEKRLDVDNGITLCEDCHKYVHHFKLVLE